MSNFWDILNESEQHPTKSDIAKQDNPPVGDITESDEPVKKEHTSFLEMLDAMCSSDEE